MALLMIKNSTTFVCPSAAACSGMLLRITANLRIDEVSYHMNRCPHIIVPLIRIHLVVHQFPQRI